MTFSSGGPPFLCGCIERMRANQDPTCRRSKLRWATASVLRCIVSRSLAGKTQAEGNRNLKTGVPAHTSTAHQDPG